MMIVEKCVNDIRHWLDSALMDMAGDEMEADRLSGSVSTIMDLIGDRTYDDCGGNLELMIEVATCAIDSKYSSGALKKAYTKKRAEWKKRLKNEFKYSPIQSPTAPFRIGGKWLNRDQAAKLGHDEKCNKAILNYSCQRD